VSAQPPAPPDPKKKADPAAAQRWEPEPTAAAFRLRTGGVSDPVRSSQGYHVVKVLEERPFKPTDAASAKDAKKKEEALNAYRDTVASMMRDGIVADFKNRLQVQPVDPWLEGYLAEEQSTRALFPPAGGKAPSAAERLGPAIAAYQKALDGGGPAVDEALAYKLAKLYEQAGKKEQALAVYKDWAERGGAEMQLAHGELLEGLKRKTDALEAYKSALTSAEKLDAGTPDLFSKLAAKFKGLGHQELAQQARKAEQKQQQEQLALQKERERQQQEMFRSLEVKTKNEDAAKKDGAEPGADAKPADRGQ
jgi:hypothetical protein